VDEDVVLTSRRVGALGLKIFNSERQLVRETLLSLLRAKNPGCMFGLMYFFSRFHSAVQHLGTVPGFQLLNAWL